MTEVPRHPLGYLARHRWAVGSGVFFLLLTNALAQTLPWIVKLAVEAIGAVAAGASSRGFGLLVLLLGGLAVTQALVRIASRILVFNAGRDAEYELRETIFDHLCQLDEAFYRRFHTGDLMSRLTNDLSAVRALFGAGVLHTVNTMFAYAVALPLMISIDGALTFWALLPYPVLLLGARAFARGIYGRSRAQQRALAEMTAAVQEDLAGIRELKSYRLEERRAATFRATSADYLRHAMRLVYWRTGMLPFVGAGAGASTVLILWLGGRQVVAGDLTLGDLVAFNLYVGLLAWPTMAIGWMLSLWQRGVAAWHRLREVLETAPRLTEPADPQPIPATLDVELRGLTVTVGEREVLRDVSFTVPAGTICAVVGRVGSGKTTLAQAVARLADVPPGTLFFGGVDATTLPLHALRRQIAYAPQDAYLFSASLADNVGFALPDDLPAEEAERRIGDAVRAAGLASDIETLADGLETVVGERGVSLSGGQRQRAALARALVARRPLLLLDDSLSAVDAETERGILERLRQLLGETTVLLISHRLAALQHADQVVVLDHGRVVERGAHDELLAADGLYSALYRRQLLEGQEAPPR